MFLRAIETKKVDLKKKKSDTKMKPSGWISEVESLSNHVTARTLLPLL